MIPPNATASGNSRGMAVNGVRRSPSSSSSDGDGAVVAATITAAASTTKKRHRGRSLRSNVLLRPRRLSIPLPLPLPLPPPQPAPDESDSEEEFSSSDYSSDDADGAEGDVAEEVETALLEYRVLRPVPEGDPGDTLFWGWVVLLSTWVVFVVGIGSVIGVWEWAWTGGVGGGGKEWPRSIGGEEWFQGEFPIPGYYPAMGILSCVMAWVWVVVAWVGLKYFKHAKIQS